MNLGESDPHRSPRRACHSAIHRGFHGIQHLVVGESVFKLDYAPQPTYNLTYRVVTNPARRFGRHRYHDKFGASSPMLKVGVSLQAPLLEIDKERPKKRISSSAAQPPPLPVTSQELIWWGRWTKPNRTCQPNWQEATASNWRYRVTVVQVALKKPKKRKGKGGRKKLISRAVTRIDQGSVRTTVNKMLLEIHGYTRAHIPKLGSVNFLFPPSTEWPKYSNGTKRWWIQLVPAVVFTVRVIASDVMEFNSSASSRRVIPPYESISPDLIFNAISDMSPGWDGSSSKLYQPEVLHSQDMKRMTTSTKLRLDLRE
ncbi:hypothetical protein B0J17DRAFT_630107 [Rhizoctonia solani]|nr:hypothetical protein B0J17DRAFT_630107 [Rhizoctonia solani]